MNNTYVTACCGTSNPKDIVLPKHIVSSSCFCLKCNRPSILVLLEAYQIFQKIEKRNKPLYKVNDVVKILDLNIIGKIVDFKYSEKAQKYLYEIETQNNYIVIYFENQIYKV